MTTEKLLSVVEFYRLHLEGMGIKAEEFTESAYKNLTTGMHLLSHCLWMLGRTPEIISQDREKADRWLGFVQGCLAALQCFTVKELRDQSRSL